MERSSLRGGRGRARRAAGRWACLGSTVRADPARAAVYDAGYRLYRELYETNRELMKKAAVIARQG